MSGMIVRPVYDGQRQPLPTDQTHTPSLLHTHTRYAQNTPISLRLSFCYVILFSSILPCTLFLYVYHTVHCLSFSTALSIFFLSLLVSYSNLFAVYLYIYSPLHYLDRILSLSLSYTLHSLSASISVQWLFVQIKLDFSCQYNIIPL